MTQIIIARELARYQRVWQRSKSNRLDAKLKTAIIEEATVDNAHMMHDCQMLMYFLLYFFV